MIRAAFAATLLSLAALPAAGDFLLQHPVDCTLGRDCYVQQYVDHDAGPDAADFRCGGLSYDGHKGTDFAVATLQDMRRGVDVLAAAAGEVIGRRDGMPDQYFDRDNPGAVEGRECGNGVVLRHPDGWETQYCHLARGSVTVRTGDRVAAGDVLGRIGLSGRTMFPHLHLSVRRDGEVVDPYDPDGVVNCLSPDPRTLWADPQAYKPGGLLAVGFSDGVPAYADIKDGAAIALPTAEARALVVYGFAFGGQAGDVVELDMTGPDGDMLSERVTLSRNQAQFFRAAGKRRRGPSWTPGSYEAQVTLRRDGVVISSGRAVLTLQ